MKIIIVQDYLRNGGTERQSVLLANAFAAAGHATHLVTFRPQGPLRTTVDPSVKTLALQTTDTTLDWFAPGLRSTVARTQPDVVLCMGRMANCYAGALQDRCPQAVVLATLRTGKVLPWLFRRSLRKVRHVVANSRAARSVLTDDHDVPADKVTVIHNSLVFTPETRATEIQPLREAHGATARTTVLLCVAMFRPEKNQQELIEIAAHFPQNFDWQLWLAGDGPTRDACENLVALKQLGARVKFPGFLRDPSALYAAADIAVHASTRESLSNFLIEAQAHGLPVVAYAAQGISETFVPDRTGWEIARDDRPAFQNRVLELARESEPAKQARADAARTFARTTFDPCEQVARYLELFTRLRSSPSS